MTRHTPLAHTLQAFFGSARLASAIATAAVGLGIAAFALHHMIGWAGLVSILAGLVALATASLVARRHTIEWMAVIPLSMLVFVAWAAASVVWSQYRAATVESLLYLAAFTVLGVYVALMRDTIQVVRVFGDVIRFVLALSLGLEVLSGVLIDAPIAFLGIDGRLAYGGPISGILGNRNELGLLAIIGAISFAIEWRTRSIDRGIAVGSLVLAGLVVVLARSPIVWSTALVAFVALAVLYAIRRIPPAHRRFWQFAALAAVALSAVAIWAARGPIVGALNSGGELSYRLRLWQQVWGLVPLHQIEGWGWIGQWRPNVAPFVLFGLGTGRESSSAVNAFLDVWFQLGIVGFFAFLGLVGLAFVRSWLLAARQRSVVFTWPALVLAALLTASIVESGILIEFGWLTFVVCCVKASQSLSWRTAFRRPLEQEPLD